MIREAQKACGRYLGGEVPFGSSAATPAGDFVRYDVEQQAIERSWPCGCREGR